MIDKKELLDKIAEEMGKWQHYYQQVESHIYSIISTCFRAKAEFVCDETKKVPKIDIFNKIDILMATIEDDVECLNAVFNTVMNTYSDIGAPFLEELIKEGEKEGATLSEIKPVEALADIENELIARQRISDESLVALRTLQWVHNIVSEAKEEA